jgi:NSS family neurotransmitter:Na+ symporter
MSEILIGRHGRQNPERSVEYCAQQAGISGHWRWLGSLTVLSAFIVLTFYMVISGWVLHYFFLSVSGQWNELSVGQAHQTMQQLLGNFPLQAFWDTLVVAGSVLVIAAGIHQGIERVVYVMFPLLVILLFILFIYALNAGNMADGLRFMFQPDFSKITFHSILAAMGQAFFSLGIALGILIMYGAYLGSEYSITYTSIAVSAVDTGIALFSGVVIFPILFAYQIAPAQGSSLIFETLPVAFSHMPFGNLFAALFFLMLEVAAFASAIGFLEPCAIWLKERIEMPRPLAAIIMGAIIWLLSLINITSFNLFKQVHILGLRFFDLSEAITAKFTLPLGGLLLALFCGWRLPSSMLKSELHTLHPAVFKVWLWCLRIITPIAIVVVLVNTFII